MEQKIEREWAEVEECCEEAPELCPDTLSQPSALTPTIPHCPLEGLPSSGFHILIHRVRREGREHVPDSSQTQPGSYRIAEKA